MRAYAILCLLHWKLYTLDTTYKPYKYRIIAAKNNNNNNTITWISYLSLFLSAVVGWIHLPLTDGPSVKCVWYKTIIFFIRM